MIRSLRLEAHLIIPGLNEVYICTKNALVFRIIHECMPAMVFNFAIILAALLLLAYSFSFKKKYVTYQLRCLCLFSLIPPTAVRFILIYESFAFCPTGLQGRSWKLLRLVFRRSWKKGRGNWDFPSRWRLDGPKRTSAELIWHFAAPILPCMRKSSR